MRQRYYISLVREHQACAVCHQAGRQYQCKACFASSVCILQVLEQHILTNFLEWNIL